MADPALLAELRVLAMRRLTPLLQEVLGKTDDALFDLSQNATGADQQVYFEAMRDLRRQRSAVEAALQVNIDGAFRALERFNADGSVVTAAGLSLVDPDALEEQLSCEQLAAAVERRHAEALHRFIGGMTRLVGSEAIDGVALPIAPLRIAQAYRDELTQAVSELQARLVSYKLLERVLLAGFGPLLDELCRLLMSRGVELPSPIPAAGRRPGTSSVGRAAAAAVAAAAAGSPDAARAAGGFQTGYAGGDDYAGGSDAPDHLFLAMRDMFAAYLGGAQGAAPAALPPGAPTRPLLDSATALSILARQQHSPPRALAGVIDDRGAEFGELLQRELLRAAVVEGLAPADVRLQAHDEQALMLVGMLFDVLLDQSRFSREVRERFARMSIPYARVAMLDRRLFAHKTHPARRLLNSLTDACDGNSGEASNERELLTQAFAIIDRLLAEFSDDVGLFAELEGSFGTFTEHHQRRVALSEKRVADAQRGRERLDEARAAATLELASLVGDRAAPASISAFLRRDWTHHLSIVALREGFESDGYRKARMAGVKLWLAFLACEQGGEVPSDLVEWLLPALQSTGQSPDTAQAAVAEILSALRALARPSSTPARPAAAAGATQVAVEDPSSNADGDGFEIVSSIEQAEETSPAPEGDLRIAADPETARPVDIARIRSLAIGQWVEFVDEEGVAQPAKLSWISPISSRLLFVNRRGMRLCAVLPEELAALMAEGKLTLREVDTAFERAMSHMLGKLKSGAPATI
jgi:hypothetical protein